MSEQATETRETFTCESCRSWTDKPVTRDELVNGWHWTVEHDEGESLYFCPECS
jgi:hypothetical protein